MKRLINPKAKLYYLARNSGLTFSQAALRDVRTILKNSEAVPAARLKEAEKAMHTLLEAAEASRNTRLTADTLVEAAEASRNTRLTADTLLEAAEASRNTRLSASRNSWRFASRRSREALIRSVDVYAGLKSICPLWPFC
jgi:hypothetical protein